MFIRHVNVKGKGSDRDRVYRYTQLVESYRRPKDGRPAHRVLLGFGILPDAQVEVLRRAFASIRPGKAPVLAGGLAESVGVAAFKSTLSIRQNLKYLDLVVAHQAWVRSQLNEVLAELIPGGASEMPVEQVLACLTLHRCVGAASKKAAERWFPTTALPEWLSVAPGRFHNTRIHRALELLDGVTDKLQERLPGLLFGQRAKPRFAALFLDVTDTWFVGRGAPLAEKAITKEGFYKYALGIVLLCDEHGFPVRWEVVPATSSDSVTMARVLESIKKLEWVREVPVVVDRAMGATASLRTMLATGLRFITALRSTEFDAYARGRIPSQAVASIRGLDAGDAERAANAVAEPGMRRVSDTRYVMDLGVVERAPTNDEQPHRPLEEANPVADALRLAEQATADVASGRVPDYSAAARALHVSKPNLSHYRHLMSLAPDLKDEIRAGKAHMALACLLRIARRHASDYEAQRRAYAEEQRRKPRARIERRRTARMDKPPAPAVRVRAVVCFNPQLFVDHRKSGDETLGKIRTFERELNERLQSARVRRSRESVYAEVDRELRHRELLNAFDVDIEMHDGHATRVDLRLIDIEWDRRRRFDGFSVIVAHPDSLQSADEIVALYRDKDCVEKDFRHIKSEIELRPMWHHTDGKVRAHVTVCMMALLVDRFLERTLSEASCAMTASAVYETLSTVHLNRCQVKGADKSLYMLTDLTQDQHDILKALAMEELADGERVAARITPR